MAEVSEWLGAGRRRRPCLGWASLRQAAFCRPWALLSPVHEKPLMAPQPKGRSSLSCSSRWRPRSRAGCLFGAGQLRWNWLCYFTAIDRIQLPDRGSFHSPSSFCTTWYQSQTQSTGHKSWLKRALGGVCLREAALCVRGVGRRAGGGAAGRSAGDQQGYREPCRLSGPLGGAAQGIALGCCFMCSVTCGR